MNCLTGQAPSNDSQGSMNPEGGEKCECQTDGGNDGFGKKVKIQNFLTDTDLCVCAGSLDQSYVSILFPRRDVLHPFFSFEW